MDASMRRTELRGLIWAATFSLLLVVFTLSTLRAEDRLLRHLPSRGLDDPDVKAFIGRLNKACPDCETYLTIVIRAGRSEG
jgi:hypothetical protein